MRLVRTIQLRGIPVERRYLIDVNGSGEAPDAVVRTLLASLKGSGLTITQAKSIAMYPADLPDVDLLTVDAPPAVEEEPKPTKKRVG
ncbi:MAG TPA: hypothetical protein VGQ69_04775 [Gemmatimonadales bacterium]|jgi:hypothetical protein|nr:hypothetical protein [Gemmatimonadales bacterium]